MEDKLKKYNCHKCGFKSDFIVHFKKHFCSSKKYQNCNDLSLSKEWLSQHKYDRPKSIFPISQRINCTGKYSCPECGYSCKSSGLLKLHKNIHYDGLYKCTFCQFVTNFENLFKMHMEEHEAENGRERLNCNSTSNLNSLIFSEDSSDMELRVPQEGNKRLKNYPSDKKFYHCSLCPFKTFRAQPFGNHLIRQHWKEVGNRIGNFVGIKNLSPKIRNSLSPSEIVALVEAMNGSENVNNISEDSNTQSDIKSVNANFKLDSVLNKLRSLDAIPKFKKFNVWTKKDKMEIYWCDVFARNEIFPKTDISKRRRKALFERGILEREKLEGAPNTLLHSITANIKIGKSTVSPEEAVDIAKDVENYVNSKKIYLGDFNVLEDLEILFDFSK